jgi:prepilin-type N-terminal cleavage/methylation domain-containing protein
MPFNKKVHGSWFMVHGSKRNSSWPSTTNYKLRTTNRKSAGFTLIEIMVVMLLIAITVGIVSTAYTSSQKKGRDAQRKSDLQQVKRAMEAAKNDCAGGSYYPYFAEQSGDSNVAFEALQTQLVTLKYLANTVTDPINKTTPVYSKYAVTYRIGNPAPAGNAVLFTSNVCPDASGTMNQPGFKKFALYSKLETVGDPDMLITTNNCNSSPELTAWLPSTLQTMVNLKKSYLTCND